MAFSLHLLGMPTILLTVSAIPTVKVMDHNLVPIIPESDATFTSVYHRHMPYIDLSYADCNPYPVVTQAGEVSGGLGVGGWPWPWPNECLSVNAQLYVRAGTYNGWTAFMYVYYFPREAANALFGFRHSFQPVVLWFRGNPFKEDPMTAGYSSGSGIKTPVILWS